MTAALSPIDVVGRAPADVLDLAYDAHAVGPGMLFFCIRGDRADGHDFAAAAVERGAVAVVAERPLELRVPQVLVSSVRQAMPRAAVAFFGDPSAELEVAAVTGTNGKTTTAFLLHAILSAAGRRPGLVGNIERRVGGERRAADLNTPEAIDLQRLFREMLDAGDRSCAMEASSHASVKRRLDGTRFATLVFTNLTQDHLDFHGSMEDYFDAKRRLFWQADTAAVNVGDPYGRRLAEELPTAATFGLAPDAEVGADALDGIDLRLRGRFNAENALGAIAAARLLGIDDDAIARGIASVEGVPGRFESVDEGQPFLVLVDYAHTPDSLQNVLRAARDLTQERLVCVFGCGGDRDRAKRPVMGRIAAELADDVIVTSDNPRSEQPEAILEQIARGAPRELEIEPDRRRAIELAVERASEGDVIVIAGKGHEQGQQVGELTLPFDDRSVARDALRRLVPTP